MFSKITLFTLCSLVFFGCFFKKRQELIVNFSQDSTSVVISGIDEVGAYQLQQQLAVDSLRGLLGLVEVRDEQTESVVVGEFSLVKDTLIFRPNVPFVKGSNYVVTTLLNSSYGTAEDILKGNLGKKINGYEGVLRR